MKAFLARSSSGSHIEQSATTDGTRRSYDAVAEEYARRIFDELGHKPFDRAWLDRFAGEVRDKGQVCDVGCGPGHVTRYLDQQGVDVIGLDLSPRMIEVAQQLNPDLTFVCGDVTQLEFPSASWAGVVAFYSLIHMFDDELTRAFRELCRVLQSEAPLLLAFHEGDEILHLDEWWSRPVSLDFRFFRVSEISNALQQTGFRIDGVARRPPYHGLEHESNRFYVRARTSGS
jgi:SAM-dependent methyltransferase